MKTVSKVSFYPVVLWKAQLVETLLSRRMELTVFCREGGLMKICVHCCNTQCWEAHRLLTLARIMELGRPFIGRRAV